MSNESTTSFLNQQLERYEIHEKIGSGGMARVYKGYDKVLEREVAIKILHEHLSEEFEFKERFEREAKFVASINHPNIVQVYDYATVERGDSVVCLMVMPLLEGQTLRDILEDLNKRDEHLPAERILDIMVALASALQYAHEKGAIHRDVKPANIILDDQYRPILMDFGIARMTQAVNLTQEGATVGTPAYMSPEQISGEPIDHRSDIYALGVILYEMIAGTPPFEDDGSLSVLLKHLNEPVPSIQTHLKNENLDAVIFKALAKDPEKRYQSAREFAEDLQRAFANQTPNAFVEFKDRTMEMQPYHTIPLPAMAPETKPHKQLLRAPLAFLLFGITVIAVLLLINFLSDDAVSSDEDTPDVLYFSTDFSQNDIYTSGWLQDDLGDVQRLITEDGYQIRITRRRYAVPTVFTSYDSYDNVSIRLVGYLTPDSSPASGYGIIFRYQDEDNYNVFAVDGQGRYSIWRREDDNWIELRNPQAAPDEQWTFSEAVNPIGELNDLEVWINDNQVAAYVNGEVVVMLEEDAFEDGQVGIYVASTSGANTTAIFTMYGVSEPSSSMTGSESMTDDDLGSDAMTGPENIPKPDW
ncbi:MAG: hypothetical protein Kow00117_14940 [Phototrophicales bacterium]